MTSPNQVSSLSSSSSASSSGSASSSSSGSGSSNSCSTHSATQLPDNRAMSPIIEKIISHNVTFAESKDYERFQTDKFPDKKLAIVSCMDTRLIELLPAALGLKNGDAKIIKVAGGDVTHPFGSVMRSLLIAVCELGVEDILVIGHTNCGAQHMSGSDMIEKMRELGVSDERIEFTRHCGIDFDQWLAGFGDAEESVRKSVDLVRNHPVMPPNVRVAGFIMDSITGELVPVAFEAHNKLNLANF